MTDILDLKPEWMICSHERAVVRRVERERAKRAYAAAEVKRMRRCRALFEAA